MLPHHPDNDAVMIFFVDTQHIVYAAPFPGDVITGGKPRVKSLILPPVINHRQ